MLKNRKNTWLVGEQCKEQHVEKKVGQRGAMLFL